MSEPDAPCQWLDWDSAFFGWRIARVNGDRLDAARLAAVDAWCAAQRIDCLYLLADPADPATIRLAEAGQFRLQDVRLTLAITAPAALPPPEPAPERVTLRPARPADLDVLRETARHAYTHSRFYNDPHFTPAQSAALYDTWLTRSLTETGYADMTFVAEVDAVPAGYIVCHLHPATRLGVIGLVGVVETARGQAVGQRLVLHALDWFWQQGMAGVQVTTQGRNLAGQRLYQRCGFLTHSLLLWYHRWSTETPRS
ncbi:MAG: GNAT family N-acetyltransferase [Anaerolineae bacterium]|jgi:dTDP-4-amino-4,6-dideoxy-D-galactose acyltransferase|nr:GNAT family N-acetyltransferase [Anaerolineae bacterium]